jgi:hypothetical protein
MTMTIAFFCSCSSCLPLGQIALETVSSPHLFGASSSGLRSKPTTHNQQTQAPNMQKNPKADATKQPPTYTHKLKNSERHLKERTTTQVSLPYLTCKTSIDRAKTKPNKKKRSSFTKLLQKTNQYSKHNNQQSFSPKPQEKKKNHPKPKT